MREARFFVCHPPQGAWGSSYSQTGTYMAYATN